jgi:WD40 repeat protein
MVKICLHWLLFFTASLLLCAGCNKEIAAPPASAPRIADKTVLLATIAEEGNPQSVAPSLGMELHTPQDSSVHPIFSKLGGGVAYSVDTNDKAFVVHNGRAGKAFDAVGAIAVSPDGSRVAHGALVAGKWRMVIDGIEGAPFSTVKSPIFSPDGTHVAYQAMSGEKWFLVVDGTPNAGTDTRILTHAFSGDSAKIAYIDDADDKKRGRLVISDLSFSRQTIVGSGVSRMIVNQSGSHLAAITQRGSNQQVISCSFDKPDAVTNGPPYRAVNNLVYAPAGNALAYSADRDGGQVMVFSDREEPLPGSIVGIPAIRPDLKGVGTLIVKGNQVYFHPCFFDAGKSGQGYDEAEGLTFGAESSLSAYTARKGNNWFVVANDVEGAGFDRVVSPKFSPNGKFLVYRARKDGKRFVVVAKKTGKIIKQFPSFEQIFDVEFTADGKSVGYGVKDGQKLIWQVDPL